jgi:hypothetical protein
MSCMSELADVIVCARTEVLDAFQPLKGTGAVPSKVYLQQYDHPPFIETTMQMS